MSSNNLHPVDIKDHELEDFKPLTVMEREALRFLHDMQRVTDLKIETFGEEIHIGRRPLYFDSGTAVAKIGEHQKDYTTIWESHDGKRWSV